MRKSVPFRLSGTLFLFNAFISSLKLMEGTEWGMTVSAVLAFLGLLPLIRFRTTPIRLIAAILPFLPLLPFAVRGEWVRFALLCPGPVWFFAVVAADRLELEYWQYITFFRFLAAAAVILILVLLLFEWGTLFCIGFAAVFLVFGVAALRMLRMGEAVDLRWTGMNLGAVVLPLLGATGIGAALAKLVPLLKPVLVLIATPIAYLMQWFTYLLGKGANALGEGTDIDDGFFNEDFFYVPPTGPAQQDKPPGQSLEKIDLTISDSVLIRILIGIASLLAIVLLVWIIWRSVRRPKTAEKDGTAYETGTRFSFLSVRKRREKAVTPAQKVRESYRRYLNLMQSMGLTMLAGTTSGEVLDNVPSTGPDDEELRRIYLLARYRGDDSITEADAAEAAGLVEKIGKRQ